MTHGLNEALGAPPAATRLGAWRDYLAGSVAKVFMMATMRPALALVSAVMVLMLLLWAGLASLASAATVPVTLPGFVSDGTLDPFELHASSAPEAITRSLLIHKEEPDRPMGPGELQRVLSLARAAWASGASPAARTSQFTPTIMWMLGVIHNSTSQPLERWLVLHSWRLWDVRFFALDADTGEILASGVSGQRVPMAERPIRLPTASFPLTLEPNQRLLLVVRIQDKTFGPVLALLHDPGSYLAQTQRSHDVQAVLFGFVMAIVLVLLVPGDWRYAVVALWLGGTAIYEFVYLVPFLPSLFPALTPHVVAILTVSGSLAIAAYALMTLTFLEVYRSRFWLVFYGLCIALLVGCAILIPWVEQHHLVRQTVGTTALAVIYTWPLAALSGRGAHKRPYGPWLLLLFAIYWIVELARVTIVNGVLKLDLYNDPLFLLYLFGLVSFALGIVAIDSRDRRDSAFRLQQALREREGAEKQRILTMQRAETARLAEEVTRQTEALRQANAKANANSDAKSKFLSTASHELRAPLHDLLGYAQLLSREIPTDAQAHLAVIQKSGQQLLQLINDILEFSRGDVKPLVLEQAPMSLLALAAHLAATCGPAAASGGNRFETRLGLMGVDWVIADERRLIQVLRNLIDNACKHTDDGIIELCIMHANGGDGAKAFHRTDELPLRFSVRDTGIGIPLDQQQAIFEPFKRLNRYGRSPGLGLGLAISQQIVSAMGGQIEVNSRQGSASGSTFHFDLRLPWIEVASEPAGPDGLRAILGYQGPPRTVLIVDDRPSSRRLLAERCECLGLKVLEAANGRKAIELLSAYKGRLDLALLDQFMPELDGWGFLRRVRACERDQALPIILISAGPIERPDDFPAELNFDEIALKPLSAAVLTGILQRHLGVIWKYAEADPEDADAVPGAHSS